MGSFSLPVRTPAQCRSYHQLVTNDFMNSKQEKFSQPSPSSSFALPSPHLLNLEANEGHPMRT